MDRDLALELEAAANDHNRMVIAWDHLRTCLAQAPAEPVYANKLRRQITQELIRASEALYSPEVRCTYDLPPLPPV